MAVKLGDIANAAGVSKATASLALNGSDLVKDTTRDTILRIAKEMNYIPDRSAQSLVKKKSGVIGVIVPDIESEYYGRLVMLLDQKIREKGYSMLLALSSDKSKQEEQAVKNFIANNVEGVIIVPINKEPSSTKHLSMLDTHKIPYIFATSYYAGVSHKCVMVNLELGSYYLAKYLLNMGRRNIRFFCGSSRIIPTITRANGIRRAFAEKGLTFSKEHIVVFNEITYDGAYSYTLSNAQSLNSADAIITVNDMMALGVINALLQMGISVPDQIAVAGYDNVTYSMVSPIPITTINQDLSRISMDSVNLLLREIRSPEETWDEEDNHMINPELIIRSST